MLSDAESSQKSPPRPEIFFVDSLKVQITPKKKDIVSGDSVNVLVTPKKELPEEIETNAPEDIETNAPDDIETELLEDFEMNVPLHAETTFNGRWSSDDEQELEPEEFADDDISDMEIKLAIRNKKRKKVRSNRCIHKNDDLKGQPVCKYCDSEFWTFKAKVEHMEVCE